MKTIKEIVEILFELQKKQIRGSISQRYYKILEDLKTLEGFTMFSKEVRDLVHRYWFDKETPMIYAALFVANGEDSHYDKQHEPQHLRKNHIEILEEKIDLELYLVTTKFISKMQRKLGDVIKSKGILEFKTEGWIQGFVTLKFSDGSSFDFSNSIEQARSKLGVYFQRYPTRFHNIKMPDGSPMKQPSEMKMKKEF